ncbi:MAG TPA: cupin domain-containing protein [Solirubrobacterales bacterium]|nr:cupin domain-containing protein [Solirubrobacterales bacterium]
MPSPFTHKQLTDVKDSGLEFGFEGIQEARFAKSDLDAEDTGIAHIRLKPKQRSPFGHKHEQAEEVYVVISGSGRMKLDEEIVEIAALDAIRVSPPVTRAFEAGSDGLELLVVGARHDGDGELVHDWWVD